MTDRIIGYQAATCYQCSGDKWYYTERWTTYEYPDTELVDPCDVCKGKGTIDMPIFSEEDLSPTPEDIHGYHQEHDA